MFIAKLVLHFDIPNCHRNGYRLKGKEVVDQVTHDGVILPYDIDEAVFEVMIVTVYGS